MGKNDPPVKPKFSIRVCLYDRLTGEKLTGRVWNDGSVPHDDIAIGCIEWGDFTDAMFNINAHVEGYEANPPAWAPITKTGFQIVDFYFDEIPIPVNEPWNTLTRAELIAVKGDFGSIIIPGLPYQPHHTLYTPAYSANDDNTRLGIIIPEYKRRNYTHMLIDITSGTTYNNYWPPMDIKNSPSRMKELYYNGIIPIAVLMDDDDTSLDEGIPYELIRIAMVKFEQNQPDHNDTYRMANNILQCRRAIREDALLFVEMSPDHGALIGDKPLYYCPVDGALFSSNGVCPQHNVSIVVSDPNLSTANMMWWRWFATIGGDGVFLNSDGDTTNDEMFEYIDTFTERFALGGAYNLPKELAVILAEWQVLTSFHGNISESDVLDKMDNVLSRTYRRKQPEGFLNGRRLP